jgi:hypothetical protein
LNAFEGTDLKLIGKSYISNPEIRRLELDGCSQTGTQQLLRDISATAGSCTQLQQSSPYFLALSHAGFQLETVQFEISDLGI